MKLLLDTHTFIWWYNTPDNLPAKVLAACQNVENSLMLSVASAWEIQIKTQLGKLHLTKPLADILYHQQMQNQLQILSITLPVIFTLDNLPLHHRDPFDRLIIAQAKVDSLTLVSNDGRFTPYPITLFWD